MILRPSMRACSIGCSACRAMVLRSVLLPYAPALTVQTGTLSTTSSFLRRGAGPISYPRYYSVQIPRHESGSEHEKRFDNPAGSNSDGETPGGNQDAEEPWYLQEEPPRHPALVQEAQALPQVPEGVPQVLCHIVKYAAEDMGLDDLNLLDLRSLNPPAALGPQLMMLFGTARGERHLHVAAGNLKSWLRGKGIQAHADGLLGPKVLKIKIRRQERKAKRLDTAAAPLVGDDGIATRWVCMNLGTIGAESQAMEFETATGFGTRQTGTTIVVQILTESKRRELDLETLWSRILARKDDGTMVEDDLEYEEADTHPNEVAIFTEGTSTKVFATPAQRRFFSTSPMCAEQVILDPPTSHVIHDVDISLDAGKYISDKIAALEHLQAQFACFSHHEARKALERSDTGCHSDFIKAWNKEIQHLPQERSWRFRLWLCLMGRCSRIEGFGLTCLREIVQEIELLGVICNRGHYLELLQAVYLGSNDDKSSLDCHSQLALEILNIMYERGEPVIATDVIVSLIESLVQTEMRGKEASELQVVLERFLLQVDLPYMGEAALIRLLDAYAAQENWTAFWEVWRMPPRFEEPRSKELYTFLWQTMAETNHQKRCQDGLRWCFHEMLNEIPAVRPVEEVKDALEACLRVADPDAEHIAKNLVIKDDRTKLISLYEFVHYWRILNPQWTQSAA